MQVILIALPQLGADQCFCLWHVFYRTFHGDYSLQIKAVDVIDAATIELSHYFTYVLVKQQQMSTSCYVAAQSPRNDINSKFAQILKQVNHRNAHLLHFLSQVLFFSHLFPNKHNSMLWYENGNTWKITQYFGRLKNIKMVVASYLTLPSTVVSFWGCDFSYVLTLQ